MDLRTEYAELFPFLDQTTDGLSQRIEKLLTAKLVSPAFPVQIRVKTWDSIAEKIVRNSLTLNSVTELSDLLGVRVVVQFRRDLGKVGQLFRENFAVLEEEDKSQELSNSEFGYQSLHFTIRVPDNWLPDRNLVENLIAEIQIRTTAQHIWASASHFFQYKKEADVPAPVRRSIHRVSALLETVDLGLERVLDEREEYRAGISDDHNRKLNVDLIESILNRSLPSDNRSHSEDYASLLADLSYFGIHSSGELEALLVRRLAEVLSQDEEAARQLEASNSEAFNLVKERAVRRAMSTHTGLVRRSLQFEFPDKWQQLRKKKEFPGMMAAMAVLLGKQKTANS